jgi:signal transduction histidine kinase/ligand-binding sensor domain-containing protein
VTTALAAKRPPFLFYRATRTKLFLVTAMLLFAIPGADAVDPKVHITQYAHTAWRMQDGFFAGSPQAVTQTSDGYLWIGTANGLFRFDGVRFVSWADLSGRKEISSAWISALHGSRDGSLWIGAGYRLYKWKDGILTEYSTRDEYVNLVLEDHDGAIWITRQPERSSDHAGTLCRVEGSVLHCFGDSDGMHVHKAGPLAEDASGNLWTGGNSQILRWQSLSSPIWNLKSLPKARDLGGVEALAFGKDGTLWVGLSYLDSHLGLGQFRDGKWKTFEAPGLGNTNIAVLKLLVDREGSIWIGTENHGVYRVNAGRGEHFDSSDGLSDDMVNDLFEDREGNIWVATSKGLDSFRNTAIQTFSKREGLSLNFVHSVLATRDKTLWTGNDGGLDALRNGSIDSVLVKDGFPGREATSLMEDPKGGLWVGVGSGLYFYDYHRFSPVIRQQDRNIVFSMTDRADGTIWGALSGFTRSTLFEIRGKKVKEKEVFPEGDLIEAIADDRKGGLWIAGDRLRYRTDSGEKLFPQFDSRYGYIHNIAIDQDDFVWLGATKGLIGVRQGVLRAMTAANGLPCERINTLILDSHRALWLYAQCGLIRIDQSELQRWWSNPATSIKLSTFDSTEGFEGGSSFARPAAARTEDGRLWFTNGSVVQTIDPNNINRNQVAPPVHVEQIIADTKTYLLSNSISLPKATKNIEIRYTGLSFVIPQRVSFQYKLQGYETDWQAAGTRRSAFYANLRPGTYTFLVNACNNDGVWSTSPAAIVFSIPPAFYQTIWFRFLLVLAGTGLIFAIDSLRVRRVAMRMKARLDERLEERGRIARELHDTLIQSVDGLMIYLQAAIDEPNKARGHDMLEKALDRADAVLAEGRERVHLLRVDAVTVEDLIQALNDYAQERAQERSVKFTLFEEGDKRPLVPLVREEVFRMAREALANAFEHSAATAIEVSIRYDARDFGLTVRDDGKGIPSEFLNEGRPGHWGLPGMRERARYVGGLLDIQSGPEEGTLIRIRIPGRTAYPRSFGRFVSTIFRRRGDSARH